jgi:hypothetical protein
MTRDEATDKARNVYGNTAAGIIDLWVSLGMLKLDEPDESRIGEKLLNACHGIPYLASMINETLAKAGLKIVEK